MIECGGISSLNALVALNDTCIARMRADGIERITAPEKERAFCRLVSIISP